MRLKERELALKEQELQMTRKLKEDELELHKQQIKITQELENDTIRDAILTCARKPT